MEKPNAVNRINDKKLKENLANMAVSTLKPDEEIGEGAPVNVEFAYVFDLEGHGLEALFKLVTDKGTYYYAAQGELLKRLAVDEEKFREVGIHMNKLYAGG